MAQKVVTVIVKANLDSDHSFEELVFPKVTEVLEKGYFVKEVHQSNPTTGGAGTSHNAYTVLTFVLQEPNNF